VIEKVSIVKKNHIIVVGSRGADRAGHEQTVRGLSWRAARFASPAALRSSALGLLSRRLWQVALALVLSLGLATVNASSASAADIGSNFLHNWQTGRCLDSNAAGSVYTNPCQSGNGYQTWRVIYFGHTDYDIVQIRDVATGHCLWRDNGNPIAAPCPADTAPNVGGTLWRAVGSSWNLVNLTDPYADHPCLDSNYAGSVYILGCNGGGYQNWKLGY
jgi:Cytolethal distending toxin A/C domain